MRPTATSNSAVDASVGVLRGHTSWVQAVSVSADGERIASASLDGTVKIWKAPREPQAIAQGVRETEE